jgi:alcohol dehydrogenase (cytochrome c)
VKSRVQLPYPPYGGVLTTAGNLVFIGRVDGEFTAYDARNLQELWSFNVGSGINAPPITYSVNGKQYVAVLVGSRERAPLLKDAPELKNVLVTSMLFVFSL